MSRHPRTLLLATRSADKKREILRILAAADGPALVTLDEAGIPPSPEEDDVERFHTFRENALAKARFFADRSGLPTLADDSGLRVAALGGEPGVFSKRFARLAGELRPGDDLDRANNRLLLRRLQDVPAERRVAHYVCAAALALPAGPAVAALGTCPGRIAAEPRGTGGFGYDPLFELPDLGRTFGQIPPEEKNRRSHRARAFRALAPHLAAHLRDQPRPTMARGHRPRPS